MIHSARAIVTPLATLFSVALFFLDLKSGRTDGRTTFAKTMIPTGFDFGLAEWTRKLISVINHRLDRNES